MAPSLPVVWNQKEMASGSVKQVLDRHLHEELSAGPQFCHYAGRTGRAVTPYRQVVRHQLSLATVGGRAVLAQTVTAQAEAVAFIDNFKLMMFVSLLAIPLVILVQTPAPAFRQRSSSRDSCKSVRSREGARGRLRCRSRKS
jgi:hypothetical protein